MYGFHKSIACSDRIIIAKKSKQDKVPDDYKLERIDVKHPGIPNKTLAHGMIFDPAFRRKVEAAIKEYNEYVDFLDALPGFVSAFVENGLMISKELALTLWQEETVEQIFAFKKKYDFETSLHICQDVLYDADYKQSYSTCIEGKEVVLPIGEYDDDICLRIINGKKCIWNWTNDGHDLTYGLWELLGARRVKDEDTYTGKGDDEQVYYEFDDDFYWCFDTMVEIQLIKIFEKLEKLGYVASYTIKPENFDPRWQHDGKRDGTIDLALVDESFKKNKLLMEQIELLMWSQPEVLKKPYYFLTDNDNKQYLSNTPGQLGGHRKLKIYGRLDCPSANRYVQQGQYVKHRVFFADEQTAIAAGYRPCGKCMPEAYKRWKELESI